MAQAHRRPRVCCTWLIWARRARVSWDGGRQTWATEPPPKNSAARQRLGQADTGMAVCRYGSLRDRSGRGRYGTAKGRGGWNPKPDVGQVVIGAAALVSGAWEKPKVEVWVLVGAMPSAAPRDALSLWSFFPSNF